MEDEKTIDPALLPFHEYMKDMCDVNGQILDVAAGVKMEVTAIETEMPLQLEIIVDEMGKITFGASPPVYYVDTGIQPVFHHLRATIVNEKEIL